jgi:hypothetical protein
MEGLSDRSELWGRYFSSRPGRYHDEVQTYHYSIYDLRRMSIKS